MSHSTTQRPPLVVLPFDFDAVADDLTEKVIDAQREVGIRTAMGFLLIGDRGRAHLEIVRSVLRQWRAASGGQIPIEPSRLPFERSTR